MGRPVLSILPRTEEKKYLLGLRTGVIPFVTTRNELETILCQFLRKETTMSKTCSNTGVAYGSTQRVMSLIEIILKENNQLLTSILMTG